MCFVGGGGIIREQVAYSHFENISGSFRATDSDGKSNDGRQFGQGSRPEHSSFAGTGHYDAAVRSRASVLPYVLWRS